MDTLETVKFVKSILQNPPLGVAKRLQIYGNFTALYDSEICKLTRKSYNRSGDYCVGCPLHLKGPFTGCIANPEHDKHKDFVSTYFPELLI